nr:Serine/threonine-protein kinase cot-1 [Colletotrichum truncatum]KAF6791247.1 Serine/threonine-protein kinase cot-1 [Colletotrichum truncatum]
MDSNNNRLYLNIGNNDRLAPGSDRQYPTTPSTFPQPVFPHQGQQQQQHHQQQQQHAGMQHPQQHPAQQPQQQQPYATGYAPSGYFLPNQQQGQYPPQAHGDYNAAYQPRSNTPGTNDPNVGLAHQFSHQNLGGAARASPYGSRGPSPGQRPRTAGAPGQTPSGYGHYATPPLPTQQITPVDAFAPAPERNYEKYGVNANNNQKKCTQLASDFFKDSVKRARERNQRYVTDCGYI